MLSVDLNAISDLLDEALDLDVAARKPWLADLALTKPDLAAKLRALLSRQDELETDQLLIDGGRSLKPEVLAKATEDKTDARAQFMLLAGTDIGPYRLIRPLGEGGMASVWLAERSDGQLKREVALKLLHAWRNSRELVERFARERDMLAGLAHPNIARLYDAGVTANGQPWIALEYVEGLDLAAFADQNALSIRSRVESILQVMAAVQYAHQNLIVHRDLKPTNILVNKKGEVRLLDFGIAKLLLADNLDAAETELTRNSGRALTFRYAAPEQIEGKPITTATDVYALGLVLYELLTGASARRSDKPGSTAALAEHAALNTEILRPSRGPFTDAVALTRGKISMQELKSILSGDIDTILLKALAREPARRYPTVGEFAADLRAWLERRPITARAPSIAYQIKMFISRQRVAVGFASAIAVVLAITGAYSQTQRAEAAAHRVRAEEVQIFMANILSEAEPEGVKGEAALTAKGLLDAGVARAREDYAEKPLVRGEMLAELARVYLRIGENENGENLLKDAISLIEKNAPADEPSLHIARSHLGGQLMGKGERDEALAMLNGVLAGCSRDTHACVGAKGNAHYHLAYNLNIDYEEKRKHIDTAIWMFDKSFGAKSANTLMALLASTDVERSLGNFAEANNRLKRAEEFFLHRRPRASERLMLKMVHVKLAFDEGSYSKAGVMTDQLLAELDSEQHADSRVYLNAYAANIAIYQGLSTVALKHATASRELAQNNASAVDLTYSLLAEARARLLQAEYPLANSAIKRAFEALSKGGFDAQSDYWLDVARVDAELQASRGELVPARKQLEAILAAFRERYPKQLKDQVHVLDSLGAVALAMGDAKFALERHTEEQNFLSILLPLNHPISLRASLQSERAQLFISKSPQQQEKVAKLSQQLKNQLPPDSAYQPVLDALISNSSNKPQLVFIF